MAMYIKGGLDFITNSFHKIIHTIWSHYSDCIWYAYSINSCIGDCLAYLNQEFRFCSAGILYCKSHLQTMRFSIFNSFNRSFHSFFPGYSQLVFICMSDMPRYVAIQVASQSSAMSTSSLSARTCATISALNPCLIMVFVASL